MSWRIRVQCVWRITSALFEEEAPGLLMMTFTNALTKDSYLCRAVESVKLIIREWRA